MSAYVYGDVLVMAATAGVSTDEIRTGRAVLIVLGTVLSTYLAHVLADTVGAVFAGHGSADLIRAELRDSLPVLSAGLPSFALLGAAAIGWPGALWAQALASAVLIGRLAGIGLVYSRLHSDVSTRTGVRFGAAVALIAAVVIAIKLLLTH